MTSNHEILGSTPSVSIFVPFCPPAFCTHIAYNRAQLKIHIHDIEGCVCPRRSRQFPHGFETRCTFEAVSLFATCCHDYPDEVTTLNGS
jgi:hypothetical protein